MDYVGGATDELGEVLRGEDEDESTSWFIKKIEHYKKN